MAWMFTSMVVFRVVGLSLRLGGYSGWCGFCDV